MYASATLPDPYPIVLPADTRAVGQEPFLQVGDPVRWRFRRFDFAHHGTEVVHPMTVVRDDARGAVLWMSGGTPVQNSRISGWEDVNPHRVPHEVRFRPADTALPRVTVPGEWTGTGVLRIVPAGLPFSVWLFWDAPEAPSPRESTFRGWYVNLEHRHVRARGEDGVVDHYSSDHTLDLWITCTGHVRLKDEDELVAAEAAGMWSPEIVRTIRAEADLALEAWHTGHWAFDAEWTRWAPPA
ncbi:DUF402 domain-containing protein [Brevibacterium litoralis]|uniref:DUF402 domain-containing protein n=1 Tax=Brevibacterium litoralis TaxID=3138935 RepID=UPI0032EC65FD